MYQVLQMDKYLDKILPAFVLFIPRLISSLLIIFFFWIAAIVSCKLIIRATRDSNLNQPIIELANTIVKVGLLMFGIVTALGTLGINISALVASLGLTGFALGFALRDALSNLLAGILILFYRTIEINDKISVGGFDGVVTKINLRYTILLTEEARILLPNSMLFTNPIKIMKGESADASAPVISEAPAQ